MQDAAAQSFLPIETPFNFRHVCWFCGEPSAHWSDFPKANVVDLSHPRLSIPTCSECHPVVNKSTAANIFLCREQVKKHLARTYQKHLAIGVQWTKEELENSGFEGKALEGFAESGWMMFEIARDRLNFLGWSLVVNGIVVNDFDCDDALAEPFQFDGVAYPSLHEAITQFALAFHIERRVLAEAVAILGRQRFAKAVRFCRMLVGKNYETCRPDLVELRREA